MIVVLITEAFHIRSVLAYALGGGVVGLACYLGLIPFDTDTLHFNGIVRRHLEIMTGAGIVAGLVYWMIAGRNAGGWREPRRPLTPPPPLPAHSPPPPPCDSHGRHSGMVRRTRPQVRNCAPGNLRFRVRLFEPPRNDGVSLFIPGRLG